MRSESGQDPQKLNKWCSNGIIRAAVAAAFLLAGTCSAVIWPVVMGQLTPETHDAENAGIHPGLEWDGPAERSKDQVRHGREAGEEQDEDEEAPAATTTGKPGAGAKQLQPVALLRPQLQSEAANGLQVLRPGYMLEYGRYILVERVDLHLQCAADANEVDQQHMYLDMAGETSAGAGSALPAPEGSTEAARGVERRRRGGEEDGLDAADEEEVIQDPPVEEGGGVDGTRVASRSGPRRGVCRPVSSYG
eukprot:g9765.t1